MRASPLRLIPTLTSSLASILDSQADVWAEAEATGRAKASRKIEVAWARFRQLEDDVAVCEQPEPELTKTHEPDPAFCDALADDDVPAAARAARRHTRRHARRGIPDMADWFASQPCVDEVQTSDVVVMTDPAIHHMRITPSSGEAFTLDVVLEGRRRGTFATH